MPIPALVGDMAVMVLPARTVLALAGLFLLGLGVVALLRPARAQGFLLGFAQTAAKHYAELALRLLVGAACLWAAPGLPGAPALQVLGWALLGTTALMALLPWRWHQRFAAAAVPRALRFMPMLGLTALIGGALLIASLWTAGWR